MDLILLYFWKALILDPIFKLDCIGNQKKFEAENEIECHIFRNDENSQQNSSQNEQILSPPRKKRKTLSEFLEKEPTSSDELEKYNSLPILAV